MEHTVPSSWKSHGTHAAKRLSLRRGSSRITIRCYDGWLRLRSCPMALWCKVCDFSGPEVVSELMPRVASMMHKFSIIRSLVGAEERHSSFQCVTGRHLNAGSRDKDKAGFIDQVARDILCEVTTEAMFLLNASHQHSRSIRTLRKIRQSHLTFLRPFHTLLTDFSQL